MSGMLATSPGATAEWSLGVAQGAPKFKIERMCTNSPVELGPQDPG